MLTDGNKAVRVQRCRDLIEALSVRLCKKNLVTIDEKFFYLRNLRPRNTIGCWIDPSGDTVHARQTARRSTMEKKYLAIVAVTQQGQHYFEVLPRNTLLNSEKYISFINDMLHYLRNCENPILPENLRLIQDNARPHVSALTLQFFQEMNIRLLKQPAYSPDCNLCDRYIFPRLEALREDDFDNIDDVKNFLETKLREFSQRRMQVALEGMIVDMQKIADIGGSYL